MKELEERGEDLSALHTGMIGYLRRIAAGQLLPEVVVRFAEAPLVLQKIATLPLPDQQKLVNGEPVKVMIFADEGRPDFRMLDPLKMTASQVHQAFASGKLRDDAEQIYYLESRRQFRPVVAVESRFGMVRADRDRRAIIVKRTAVPVADVVSALADMRRDETPGDRDSQVLVPLTESEHRRLRVAAAEAGTTMTELARNALRAMGVI